MKIIYISALILIFANIAVNAQTLDKIPPPPPPTEKLDEDVIFTKVEVEAQFPGGLKEWSTYLQKNLNANVPVDNKARKGKYTVVVRFIVAKDGSISEVLAETNHGFGMEKEVMRVIKKGPNWKPAMQNGNVVKAYRRQPVIFLVL